MIDPRSDHRLPSNWADSDETGKAPWTEIEATDFHFRQREEDHHVAVAPAERLMGSRRSMARVVEVEPPDGEGQARITGKNTLAFKWEDSFKNSGTGTIRGAGRDIVVSMKTTRVVDSRCLVFYGENMRLKRVK